MKIAMIGQKGMPTKYGGIEKHVEELSVRLAQKNNEVYVYTRPYYTNKDKRNFQGVHLISLPSIHTKHLDAISHTFLATMHAIFNNYDIIHFHGVGPSLLTFLPKLLKPKTKIVATFHCIDRQHQKWGTFAKLMLWLGEKAICRFADEVVAVSKTIQNYCYEAYNRDTCYIPNGISAVQNIKPSLIQKKYNLNGNDYILLVTRLIPHKGVQYLISAYQKIKTNKKLVIVGDSSFTDDYVKKIKNLAKNNPNIIFTGWLSGQILSELYSNAYLYVQPSESEGLPISVLEAASFGKCVLASDIPANLEIVSECGISFVNKNINDLSDKLNYLLREPFIVEKTGKYAKKFVLKNYNWQDIVENTNNLYKNLLAKETAVIKESFCPAGR